MVPMALGGGCVRTGRESRLSTDGWLPTWRASAAGGMLLIRCGSPAVLVPGRCVSRKLPGTVVGGGCESPRGARDARGGGLVLGSGESPLESEAAAGRGLRLHATVPAPGGELGGSPSGNPVIIPVLVATDPGTRELGGRPAPVRSLEGPSAPVRSPRVSSETTKGSAPVSASTPCVAPLTDPVPWRVPVPRPPRSLAAMALVPVRPRSPPPPVPPRDPGVPVRSRLASEPVPEWGSFWSSSPSSSSGSSSAARISAGSTASTSASGLSRSGGRLEELRSRTRISALARRLCSSELICDCGICRGMASPSVSSPSPSGMGGGTDGGLPAAGIDDGCATGSVRALPGGRLKGDD